MIVIGIPYHKAKRYAINHVLDWLENQTCQDVEPIMRWHTGQYGEQNAVKAQLEFFRKTAVANNADLFIMEADTIPPLDGLTKLNDDNLLIVGGLYRYRDQDKPIVAWPKEKIKPDALCEVDGMGTGCVLLRNHVLSEFTFYDWDVTDADYPLFNTLRNYGHTIYLDTRVECKHYINETEYA